MTTNGDKEKKTANGDKEQPTNLRVFQTPFPEQFIEGVAPRQRLGRLFRVYRERAGRNLRETAEALHPVVESTVVLGEIERGRRPATAEQIQSFCRYIGVSSKSFYDAAKDYHRSVWQPRPVRLKVCEQSACTASTEPVYDQRELTHALQLSIDSMDLASELLAGCSRILRHLDGYAREAELAASAALTLEGTAGFSRGVIEHPLDPLLVNPPNWAENDEEEGDEE